MKRYYDPELEVVCFDAEDVTNFGEGEGPEVPGDELSGIAKGWYSPKW